MNKSTIDRLCLYSIQGKLSDGSNFRKEGPGVGIHSHVSSSETCQQALLLADRQIVRFKLEALMGTEGVN